MPKKVHPPLSPYLRTVLSDFYGLYTTGATTTTASDMDETEVKKQQAPETAREHNKHPIKTKKRRQHLCHIACQNIRGIVRVSRNNTETKAMVLKRDAQLSGCSSHREKDWTLINEFLGWASTAEGHFVYVYYVGNVDTVCSEEDYANRLKDMANTDSWKLVSHDHLQMFHTALSRVEMTDWWPRLTRLDITGTEDGRGNLALDVRYLVKKWLSSHGNSGDSTDQDGCLTTGALCDGAAMDSRHAKQRRDYIELLVSHEAKQIFDDQQGYGEPLGFCGGSVPDVESVHELLSGVFYSHGSQ